MVQKTWLAAAAAAVIAAVAAVAYLQTADNEAPAPQPEPAASATAEPSQTAAVGQPALYDDDRILGQADAPVTIIEYASLTCPHCANFHNNTMPKLKSEYIDKGLVRFVYRDFPLNKPALTAALLAFCVPDERYFSMLEVLFRSQGEWAAGDQPEANLAQVGRTAGLDQGAIDGCFADQATADRIVARAQEGQQKYGIESTPTFLVNGARHDGALSFESFDTILKGLLPQ